MAPPAFKVVEFPVQIVPVFTVTAPPGLTVTVAVVTAEHVPAEPVMVYVVVLPGFAVTLAPVVELKPVAGDQV